MANRTATGPWLLGLALIAVGVLFLLDTTGVLDAGDVFSTYWPLLLIAWGLWMLVRERGRSLAGVLVVLLGAGFQAEELDWIESGWLGRLWPLVLIIVGIAILVGLRWPPRSPRVNPGAESLPEEWFDTVAFISERDQRVTAPAWRGGRVVAVMGEATVDLREATPHVDGAQVRATAVMGTVRLMVPEGWSVTVRATPVLGSVEDKTEPMVPRTGPGPRTAAVQILATALLGQVEIQH